MLSYHRGWLGPVLVLLFSTAGASAAHAAPYKVTKGSKVTFVAHITGGSFEAVSETLKGTASYDPATKKLDAAEVSVDATSFTTGMSLRDKHMRDKYLEAGKFPAITFKASPDGITSSDKGLKLKGAFVIKGVQKPIEVPLQVQPSGSDLVVKTKFPLTITDYGIKQPSFAVVKMDTVIEVSLELVFTPGK